MVDKHSFPSLLARRSRRLTHFLILSVTLNIAFLATLLYTSLRDKVLTQHLLEKKKKEKSSALPPLPLKIADTLSCYLRASFSELIDLLEDETLIEQGQLACDLAFACLAEKHFFDVERALSGALIEKRDYAFQDLVSGEWVAVTLFSGLGCDERAALRCFARYELWPLTAEGLFLAIKREQGLASLSLKQAFFFSLEFYTIHSSLNRWAASVSHEELLELLLEADWASIASLVKSLKSDSEQKKRCLLEFFAKLFENKESKVGPLLFTIDADFAFRQLSDKQLRHLIAAFDTLTFEVETFLTQVAESLRSDSLRQQARKALSRLHGSGKEADAQSPSSIEARAAYPLKSYVVQFGDSLWKISRRFQVSIHALKTLNELHSDILLPGKTLLIPPSNAEIKEVENQGT